MPSPIHTSFWGIQMDKPTNNFRSVKIEDVEILLDAYDNMVMGKANGVTNFPESGDDLKVSLRNSKYDLFPVEEAQDLKDNYLSVWREGGNIRGNRQFELLAPIARRGGNTETLAEENAVRRREAWAARHFEDYSLAGVVAQVKWLVVGSRGIDHMRQVIREAKDKLEKSMTEERVYPRPKETKDEFISRCMGWAAMVSEFPDSGQRYAVCERYWAEGPQTKIEPNPCWDGYEAIGLKPNGDPNCVPVKAAKLYHLKEAAKKQIDISFNKK
jgi:hypothetical protein